MDVRRISLGVVGVAALLFGGIALPAAATQGHQSGGTSMASCNDGTVTASPAILWPPNHKLIPINVSYFENSGSGDGDSDQIQVTNIDVSFVDGNGQVNVEGHGAGQPSPQQQPDFVVGNLPGANPDTQTWTTKGTDDVQIRSERAGTVGNGSGRVYMLKVTCKDTVAGPVTEPPPPGGSNMGTVFVCVPHDQSDASTTFCKNKIK